MNAGPECGDELTEGDWEEGFRCNLTLNHCGPHRDVGDGNQSMSNTGRKYRWAYEWIYDDVDKER
jgi:hypothetical protein